MQTSSVLLSILLINANAHVEVPSATNAAWKFIRGSTKSLLRSTETFRSQHDGTLVLQEVGGVKRRSPQSRLPAGDFCSSLGFYYGLSSNSLRHKESNKPRKRVAWKDTMVQTLDEIRTMRQEMEQLRKELVAMKRRMSGETDLIEEDSEATKFARLQRKREFDKMGVEVEKWAEKLLFEERGEVGGWNEISCNRVFRGSFNAHGRTKAFLKWMPDPRISSEDTEEYEEYPCMKVYSTIDAPLDCVCNYLSDEQNMPEYNDLVVKHRDLEDVTSHSKICWGQTPQILFIKPRTLITFCHHRWKRDGTQVVVNQACDFEGLEANAYALRGATFISQDPNDPEKTRLSLLALANPGSDIPKWACKTAVNTVAPIEPFKLFHKINQGVLKKQSQFEATKDQQAVGVSGRRPKPAGLSQMGYACFWPNGGSDWECQDEMPTDELEDTEASETLDSLPRQGL